MEVLHDLVGYADRYIFEDTDGFSFSLDSVLLARFVSLRLTDRKILDLGTGTAPIPLILSFRTSAHITGVEIQKTSADLAKKSVRYNHLEDQIDIIEMDMKDYVGQVLAESFDVITVNPPYFKYSSSSITNLSKAKMIARHEVTITLEEIVEIASKLLRHHGVLAMVHRADRLIDVLELYRAYHIEPKRIQFVFPKMGKDANMILIEGKKNGSSSVKIEPSLYVHNEDGSYTDEVKAFFEWRKSL